MDRQRVMAAIVKKFPGMDGEDGVDWDILEIVQEETLKAMGELLERWYLLSMDDVVESLKRGEWPGENDVV